MAVSIFVGFFGLARSLGNTIDSIEQNVFAPILDAKIKLVRAAHLNCPKMVHSPRSGEQMVPYQVPDLSRLQLDAEVLEDQSDSAIAPQIESIMKIPQNGEDDDDGNMRRNVVHQMNSLKGLSRLFSRMDPQSYNAVIILRPDLRYIDPFPIRKFLTQIDPDSQRGLGLSIRRGLGTKVDLITPGWHLWGGLNDRIAIANAKAAQVYMNRLDRLEDYGATHSHFQSEHLLKFVADEAGLKQAKTWVRADRVRATGEVEPRDLDRRENILKSALRPLRSALQL